jgi:predicted DCC family thiol-disulfide oxidoreductase YuxK
MPQLTIWYGAACPLCRREIAVMRKLDRKGAIAFVDATTAPRSACPIEPGALLTRLHASENGLMLSGAAAFATMWRAIPLLRPLGLAARVPVVLSLLEHAYRMFLRFRPRLHRWAGASP